MADSLPNEVLTSIATYISPHNLRTCLCVCRSWNIAFTPVLYGSVKIDSPPQLKLFIKTLHEAKTCNLGHLIHKLTITTDTTFDEIASLPRLCPNVVEYSPDEICYSNTLPFLQRWKHLSKMPMVAISSKPDDFSLDFFRTRITRLRLSHMFPDWIKLITALPCIEELDLVRELYDADSDYIQISDLEKLHKALPRLRSFSLYDFPIRGRLPWRIVPCDTMRKFHFQPGNDHIWGRYFAKKYRNLEYLGLCGCYEPKEDITADALRLIKSCQKLKVFESWKSDGDASSMYRQCVEKLLAMGAPLIDLTLDSWDPPSYATITNGFHKTISKLCITVDDDIVIQQYLEPLKTCSHLAELWIFSYNDELEIDCLLNYCCNLQSLFLRGSSIRINNNDTVGQKHNLTKLSISGENIDDNVFPYVSQRCPRISTLGCTYLYDCDRSCVIYLPKLMPTAVRIFHSDNSVYKVTHIDKIEEIKSEDGKHYELADEHKVQDWTKWYRHADVRGPRPVRELGQLEIDEISGRLSRDDQGCSIKNLDGNDEVQGVPNGTSRLPLVWIQCHSAQKVILEEYSSM